MQQVSVAGGRGVGVHHRSSEHTGANTFANTATCLCPEPNKETGQFQAQYLPMSTFPIPTFPQSWRLINSSLESREHVCRGFNYSRKLAQLVLNVE